MTDLASGRCHSRRHHDVQGAHADATTLESMDLGADWDSDAAPASCAERLADSLADGSCLRAHGHSGRVFDLAFHPTDPELLASASDDNTVGVWRQRDIQRSGRAFPAYVPAATFTGHRDSVMRVNWAPDGSMLASGSADGTVQLWRLDEAVHHQPQQARQRDLGAAGTHHAATLGGHPEEVYACVFLPDSEGSSATAPARRLLSASGKHLFLWDIQTKTMVQRAEPPPPPPPPLTADAVPERWRNGHLFGVAVQQGGPLVCAACSDGHLRFWSREGAAILPVLTVPAWSSSMGSDCAFGAQHQLAAVSKDGAVLVMDLRQAGHCLQHVDLGVPLLSCRMAQHRGGSVVVAAGGDGSVHFVDLATGAVDVLAPPALPPCPLLCAEVAPDGRRLAVAGEALALGDDDVAAARQQTAKQLQAAPVKKWAPLHVWVQRDPPNGEG